MFSFLRRNPPIEEFWQWFKANRQRLQGEEVDGHAYRQLSDRLRDVDRSLTYEIRREENAFELQLSADGIPELIPLVRELVGKSPSVPGWNFLAFRQPRPEGVVIDVFGQVLTPANVLFAVDQVHDGVADLTLFVPGLTEENYRHLAHCAMMIMESVIGEYDLMVKIDQIEYEPIEGAAERETRPVADLRSALS